MLAHSTSQQYEALPNLRLFDKIPDIRQYEVSSLE